MVANINPIYTRQGDCQGVQFLNLTASTPDGSGANLVKAFQADTSEGGWVDSITFKPIGSPAATVLRVYICTATGTYTAGTTNTTSNTFCIGEATCAAVTASTTVAQNDVVVPIRAALGPGQFILVGNGTATGAATGYSALVRAGKY